MDVQEFYELVRGDYEDVCFRLPSDEFILRFLKKFRADTTFSELLDAVQSGDINQSFEAAHKLKGIAANLGFKELYQKVSFLTEQLRKKTEQADASLLDSVNSSYQTIIKYIQEL